ncbi:hypothetical protein X011_09310 [Mycobacterium tuberculosis variant microti OV254]|nr:CoA transferase [Mycobacterium simiae]PLV52196.1 hypothetical protein X011_09310 [Mycobacterium tuberculosis variant microti OV254]
MSALTPCRVVELAGSVAGEYCGKLLADFGAEVIKVESPGCGSPTRALAPRLRAGPDGGVVFAYLNTNKLSVVFDAARDGQCLHGLLGTADAVIHDGALSLADRYPDAVFCSITQFARMLPPNTRMPRASTCSMPAVRVITRPAIRTPASRRCRGPAGFCPTTRRAWKRRCA